VSGPKRGKCRGRRVVCGNDVPLYAVSIKRLGPASLGYDAALTLGNPCAGAVQVERNLGEAYAPDGESVSGR
jgi:hypothetical protein